MTKGEAKTQVREHDTIIGAHMKALRQRAGMSQEQTGEVIGVTFQQIQKYEKGTNRISAGKLVTLSKAFGVPLSEFYRGLEEVTLDERGAISLAAVEMGSVFDKLDEGDQKMVLDLCRKLANQVAANEAAG